MKTLPTDRTRSTGAVRNRARCAASASTRAVMAVLLSVGMMLVGQGLASAYPPGSGVITVEPDPSEPGQEVLVTVTCRAGETVTIALLSSTATDRCLPGRGPAALRFTEAASAGASGYVRVPMTPGEYGGSINGSVTGSLGTFVVTVVDSDSFEFASLASGLTIVETSFPINRLIVLLAIVLAGIGAIFGVARMRET